MSISGMGMPILSSTSSVEAFGDGAKTASKEVAENVATHFEAVFMSMMLKEMRATLSDGLFGKEGSDTFGALFDLHMGQHLADSGGVGLREMVAAEYASNSKAAAE